MRKETLFTIDALPYRQPIPVYGYYFGNETKTLAVMGAIRGDEFQQMYTAAQLIKRLSELEKQGRLSDKCGILVIPCAGQFSMNVEHRFWPLDNTDINRMFPGYNAGETTQRLASRIFDALKGYCWGIHLTSLYLPGDFEPHIRIMDTGLQKNETGLDFGLPYLVIRTPHPYDTTTLNYNWQVWETNTFSLYTRATDSIDEKSANEAINSILRFLAKREMIDEKDIAPGVETQELNEKNLVTVHNKRGGILLRQHSPGDKITRGEEIAQIIDPYTSEVREKIFSPSDGVIFFARHAQILPSHTVVFRIIA
ncbi:MAG: succinylglutamate desuccinylase/aspartoacylase family protein [Schwartzia sp.]|nr:succinylglutamate desuccinylase/aspartoacylase family protein [Schwartzia sp. (in: firmicutes)]